MRIYHSIEEFSAKNPVVTIGMFDGVHSGHREILRQLNVAKQNYGGESVLLTFWPHPRIYFGKTENFKMLTTLDEKMELLEQSGLDVCLILPFSSEMAQLTPEEYITKILCEGIHARKIVIGYDHKYGRNGAGTFELMQEYGHRFGYDVEQISAQSVESEIISSTKVRKRIEQGDVETGNSYLSYEYFLNGEVVPGSQIGRTIGFPTANVKINSEYKEIPAKGVYAGRVLYENTEYKAVINIGNNPTIRQNLPLSVEVHLLDFQQDLYGKNIRVVFAKRLRDEQHFSSLEELQMAIEKDVALTQSL